MYIPRVLTYIYVYKYLHTYIYIYLERERERDSERLDKTSSIYLQYVFRSVIYLKYHMCNTICIDTLCSYCTVFWSLGQHILRSQTSNSGVMLAPGT